MISRLMRFRNASSISLKYVAGGSFTTTYTSMLRLGQLNNDGTADTFSPSFNNAVNTIAIQSDNKIVCGGAFTSYNGTAINRIARLNTDGTLDSNFIVGTGFLNAVYAIAIQPDGKILVGGSSLGYNGFSVNQLLRLNADGTFDRFPLRGPSSSVFAIGLSS